MPSLFDLLKTRLFETLMWTKNTIIELDPLKTTISFRAN